ncbi:TPA: hypothetical protein ACL1TL_004270 [Pseudomonas aeruginosa]|uniref:hypothetical protein n=1 Tax=Pseudomonas aeruginosa TaxID=287 RepID=UPI0021F1DB2A|nr:hypothetical protein [Pseudomonas aeruginosa]MCV6433232.1 hypothetical protein [Pseudomonas aeruginosa]MCV6440913.1 hypothetical protein [Pseudomonas aeruginosa]HBO5832455.1 hypothetical protein [Pseudomonas aeruginosa]
MPDMREEFEAWWNLPAQSELRKSCARGWAEVIWKASRAALKVELPERAVLPEYTEHRLLYCERTGFNDCLERVKEALQQAGIEVAP